MYYVFKNAQGQIAVVMPSNAHSDKLLAFYRKHAEIEVTTELLDESKLHQIDIVGGKITYIDDE